MENFFFCALQAKRDAFKFNAIWKYKNCLKLLKLMLEFSKFKTLESLRENWKGPN